MKFAARLLLLAVVLAWACPLRAQKIETARLSDIEHLIEYGFDSRDIIAWLGEEGRRLEIDEKDVAVLIAREVDQSLVDWLNARLPKTAPRKIEVADVIARWQAGTKLPELLDLVKAADRVWLLGPADVLALARAEVPKPVIDLMRGRVPGVENENTVGEKIGLDDILAMANEGLAPAEIIARIEASPSRYEIDTQRILELKRDGVPLDILQAIFRKRRTKAPVPDPANDAETIVSQPDAAGATRKPIELAILRDQGIGFSMLRPADWVVSKDYVSTRSLTQMVDPAGAEGKGLPDVELSIMTVHPKRRSETEPSPAQLEAIAASFVETLKGQFARDGIDLLTERPLRSWLAAHAALRIDSQARVAATNRSYRGAFYILQAQGRIWVISYSCRLEQGPRWLQTLEDCARSLSFNDENPVTLESSEGGRESQVQALFEAWRRSLRRFDFDRYRKLHDDLPDEVVGRRQFLALARSISDEGRRLEIDGVDFAANLIRYNMWGLDGRSTASLGFLRKGSSYRLTRMIP